MTARQLLDLQLNHPYFAKSLAIKPDDRPEDDKKILQLIRRAAKDVVDDADAVFTTLPVPCRIWLRTSH